MKTRSRLFTLLLAMVLAIAFGGVSAAASDANKEETTEAVVKFLDGNLSFSDDAGITGMNLYFGENTLPVKAIDYTATNQEDSHRLAVEDSRYDSGNWGVNVTLSTFKSDDKDKPGEFEALIRFDNAIVANANDKAGFVGLSVGNSIEVTSDGGTVPVMSASNELPRGLFTSTWKNKDVTLSISNSEVVKISNVNYSAELQWILYVGPN